MLALVLPLAAGWVKTSDYNALVELYEATNGAAWEPMEEAPEEFTDPTKGRVGADDTATPVPPAQHHWHGARASTPATPHRRPRRWPEPGVAAQRPEAPPQLTGQPSTRFSHNSRTIPTERELRNMRPKPDRSPPAQQRVARLVGTALGRGDDGHRSAQPDLIGSGGSRPDPRGRHPDESIDPEDLPPEQLVRDKDGFYPENITLDVDSFTTMGLQTFHLGFNNLNGTIPTTIGELVNLHMIDLSNNPEMGATHENEGDWDSYYWSFYGYNTTLPTEIGLLKKVQILALDYARFQRHLPTEIGKMRSLTHLRLVGTYEGNQVSGTIPTEIGSMKHLQEWKMENNTLSGTIPSELGLASELEYFDVADNKLSATIPDIFGGLPQLILWDTFNNKLSGDFPPSIQNISAIEYLYIQNEHTDAMLNYYCQQRIDNSAIGRKTNWAALATEYINWKYVSACANPYDKAGAYDKLWGDV